MYGDTILTVKRLTQTTRPICSVLKSTLTSMPEFFPYTVHTHDMSCAVCKTNRSASVMIPTRDVYYPDWTEEYHGYLMAGTSGYQGTNHIYMDDESQVLQQLMK